MIGQGAYGIVSEEFVFYTMIDISFSSVMDGFKLIYYFFLIRCNLFVY